MGRAAAVWVSASGSAWRSASLSGSALTSSEAAASVTMLLLGPRTSPALPMADLLRLTVKLRI
jgi:hypothetical protein